MEGKLMRVVILIWAVMAMVGAKRLMVKVDPTAQDVDTVLSQYGDISVRLPQINTYFLEVTNEEHQKRSIQSQIESYPAVLRVSEDGEGSYGLAEPNDPRIGEQWALEVLGAFEIWEISPINPDRNLTIAMCDGGYRLSHEDLVGVHFYPGYNLRDNIEDVIEYSGEDRHATHVIGAMVAMANNSKGIAGLAHGGVSILPYRVASISSWVQCLVYSADAGADVINLSIQANYNDSFLYDAVNYAYDSGVFVSACGGNTGFSMTSYPGMAPNAFGVGWIQSDLTISSGSVTGPHIDVVAPGASILSTTYAPSSYESWGGCSMATPYVSAAAALLKNADPSLSVQDMYDLFTSTATDLGAPGRDDVYGSGLINPLLAIKIAKNVPPALSTDPLELVFAVPNDLTVTVSCTGPESYDNCTSLDVLEDLPPFMNAVFTETGMVITNVRPLTEADIGSYDVTLTATDNFRGEATRTLTIEVTSAPSPGGSITPTSTSTPSGSITPTISASVPIGYCFGAAILTAALVL